MGTDFSLAHLHSKAFRWNIAITFGVEKLEWRGYSMVKKFENILTSFDRIHKCDGQSDGQTDTV